MNFLFTLSLEQRALANIAVTLWSQDDVKDLMSKSAFHILKFGKWQEIEKVVIQKSFELQLPEKLKEKLLSFIMRVGLQFLSWLDLHHCNYNFVTELPTTFVWTSVGTINNMKTAKLLVMGGTLDGDKSFALAYTEKVYTSISQAIASRYGKTFTWEVKVKCMGKVSEEAARTFIEELQLPMTIEEYYSACAELYDDQFSMTEVLPGVEKLVRHLHSHNVPIAIATSSKKETYDLKTKNHQELISKFHHVVCGSNDEEVKRGKPAPDIFLVCNSRFDSPPVPEKVLVFEDAPNGVQAAVAAGMQVVMVPDPRMEPEFCREATLVLSSLEHFRPELFNLPPYPNEA